MHFCRFRLTKDYYDDLKTDILKLIFKMSVFYDLASAIMLSIGVVRQTVQKMLSCIILMTAEQLQNALIY